VSKKYLIVGASRGIGLGLVRALSAREQIVVATSRNGESHASASGWLALDILDSDSRDIAIRAATLEGTTHVVVAAGIMPKTIDVTLEPPVIAEVFLTNSIAPIVFAEALAQRLAPRLQHIMFLGSRMGSVELNQKGDDWIYRASKAALNSAARSFYIRKCSTKGIAVTGAHPGWVRTEMGGKNAEISVQTSVDGLLDVLDEPVSAGAFRYCDYLGNYLPY